MSKSHDSLALKKNPHPVTDETAKRYLGGNTSPEVTEKHGQKKGTKITEDRRFAGAETTSLKNSPGRVNEDVSGE